MNFDLHPCFNAKAHRTHGRVHLPVAPRCNIQCKFCNRKFDCVNESRPGVTSGVLTPAQAMVYLETVFEKKANISVVGIAGPGDPFANPEETLETCRRVRRSYPDMLLCIATNGLNAAPYLDELADLSVSHVTVTVNAVDPVVGARIYAWVRHGKRVRQAREGAEILLENQLNTINGLKARGITVKVNTILIPGINMDHVETVAKHMAELGVDILNCVPYYPNEGSAFGHLVEPTPEEVHAVREKAGKYLPQMRHCTRCRADAVGLLGETPDADLMEKIRQCEQLSETPPMPVIALRHARRVAVASREGVLVNQHLGEAEKLYIYENNQGRPELIESRPTPPAGGGQSRWEALFLVIRDCDTLLVNGIGESPRRTLTDKGIEIFEIEALIEEAVQAVFDQAGLKHLAKREMRACGGGCSGGGMGCG
jgi:nitrogen fixation protein NifB